ncbi:hypothetical protein EIP86_000224 [Pleurotus ostreatoroseus]|nr:hypothetical protein EIP86_000224 [Pleurotus ostreatoroseus]
MPTAGKDVDPRAVFVLGASSSGKTTLCNALAQDLQLETELYIREVARNVMKMQGFSRKHTHLYEMQEAIMLAQLQAERSAAGYTCDGVRREDILLLSDRSAIDPVVYAATSGTPDAQDMQHRLLETPSLQQNMAFYRRSLFELDISFIVIPEELKKLDERVALVKSHLIQRSVLRRFVDFDLETNNFSCEKAIYNFKCTSKDIGELARGKYEPTTLERKRDSEEEEKNKILAGSRYSRCPGFVHGG